MRVAQLLQFYIYHTSIKNFQIVVTITNTQKFSLLKIVDFVPYYEILMG